MIIHAREEEHVKSFGRPSLVFTAERAEDGAGLGRSGVWAPSLVIRACFGKDVEAR